MKPLAVHIPTSKIVAYFSISDNTPLKALIPQHLKNKLHCFKVVLWIMTDGKREREEEGGRKEDRRVGL